MHRRKLPCPYPSRTGGNRCAIAGQRNARDRREKSTFAPTAIAAETRGVLRCLQPGPGSHWFRGIPVFRKRAQRGFIAWMAFAALGLLLVAPTISRTLATLATASSTCVACPDEGMRDSHALHHDPAAPSALDACAYCTLMSHNPVLTAALLSLLPVAPASLPATALVVRATPLLRPLDVRPRGPPLV
jgi:hypothetical protein